MARTRMVVGALAVPAALLVAACAAAGRPASGTPAGSPSATPAPAPVSATAAGAGPAATSPAGAAPPTASATATTSGCAALAAHTFLHVTAAKAAADGSLTLTGNPASLVCGGADDLHYDFTTATVTGHVIPRASIMVFPLPAMRQVAIDPDQLAAYLAGDKDTRIFLVTGPLSRITSLQEEYHP